MAKHEDKMLKLQRQLRENQTDLKDFLKDLDEWENDIKEKEKVVKSTPVTQGGSLPPVRNSLTKKKRKKVKKKEAAPSETTDTTTTTAKPKVRISSYDYRAWDKFDVDKALESDGEENGKQEVESSDYETDEDWEEERQRQAAILEKDAGNQLFKEGKFEQAIECYSKGAELDRTNPLLPANRAMALLKLDRFAAAEVDCTTALTLDPTYVKAYLRRGAARVGLKATEKAKADFQKALQLEPQNSTAKIELKKIERILLKAKEESTALSADGGIIQPIHKEPKQRSKKPLRRIEVEEIGVEDDGVRAAILQTESSQGATKRLITEQDSRTFQKFTAKPPGTDLSDKEELRIPLIEDLGESESNVPDKSPKTSPQSTGQETQDSQQTVLKQTLKDELRLMESSVSRELAKSELTRLYSPPVSPQTSPRTPGVPLNSYQFQKDWKFLKNDTAAIYQYFKNISPENYNKLFGEALDAEILMKLILVFKDFSIPHGDDLYPPLCHLTTVKRFDMIVMFLSSKEKQVVVELFQQLEGKINQSELTELRRCYGCS